MENNCLASHTKLSQTDCYILCCPLQSIFSFLDRSKFIVFIPRAWSSNVRMLLWLQPHQWQTEGNFFLHFTCNVSVNKNFCHILLTYSIYYPLLSLYLILQYLYLPISDSTFVYVVFSITYTLFGSLQITTSVYQDF